MRIGDIRKHWINDIYIKITNIVYDQHNLIDHIVFTSYYSNGVISYNNTSYIELLSSFYKESSIEELVTQCLLWETL